MYEFNLIDEGGQPHTYTASDMRMVLTVHHQIVGTEVVTAIRAKRDLARAEAEYAARELADQRYLTCWCGGAVGPREPGDANGLGCQENLYHVWKGSTERE